MASVSDTSYWINFFTSSGIPAGDATQYAIIFSDNRITREMLLDLSKEYLTDMGITRLGDVISILKHAKEVFNQEARDRIMKSTSLSSLSSQSPTFASSSPRRSTAASRMVNHITSKHPEAAPMSQTPVAKPIPPDPPKPKRKVSIFERLGEMDSQDTVTLSSTKSPSSQSSVFSRLGGKAAAKRASSSTSQENFDSVMDSSPSLPYAGVLKNTPSPVKKAKIVKLAGNKPQANIKIIKTIKNTEDTSLNIQRPEVSTTTEGVLSDFAKKDSLSLKERLGCKTSQIELPTSTINLPVLSQTPIANPKTTRATANVGIQKRLGEKRKEAQSSPVVSSTQQKPIAKAKRKGMASEAMTKQSGGVFSRLGKKPS